MSRINVAMLGAVGHLIMPVSAAAFAFFLQFAYSDNSSSTVVLKSFETVSLVPATDRSINGNSSELGVNLWAETDQTLEIGDTGASNEEVRGVMEFDLSSVDITAATNIILQLTVGTPLNTPFNWTVMHMTADNDGVITLDDYQASAVQVSSVYSNTTPAETRIFLDVTSQVKSDALQSDWSAFRIQVSDSSTVSDNDGTPERVRIYSCNALNSSNRPQLLVSWRIPDAVTLPVMSFTDRSVNDDGSDVGVNLWAETDQTLDVGDTGAGNDEVRGVMEFDLSSVDIASATNISLQFTVGPSLNSPFDWMVMHMTSDNDGVITLDDYQASAVQISAVYSGTVSTGTTMNLNVTSQVQSDALSGSWSAFRMQVSAPAQVSDGDSVPERIRIYSGNSTDAANCPKLLASVTYESYMIDDSMSSLNSWTLESSFSPVSTVISKDRILEDQYAELFSINEQTDGWVTISDYNINVAASEFSGAYLMVKCISGNDPLTVMLESEGRRFFYKQSLSAETIGEWQAVLLNFDNFIDWGTRTSLEEEDAVITKFSISLSNGWGDNEFMIRDLKFVKSAPDTEDLYDQIKTEESAAETEAVQNYTDSGYTNIALNAAVRACSYENEFSSRNVFLSAATDGTVDRDQHAGVAFYDALNFFIYLPYTEPSTVNGLMLMTAKKVSMDIGVYSLDADGGLTLITETTTSYGYFHDIALGGASVSGLYVMAVPTEQEDLPGMTGDSHVVGNVLLEAAVYGRSAGGSVRILPDKLELTTLGNYGTNDSVIVSINNDSGVTNRLSGRLRLLLDQQKILDQSVALDHSVTNIDLTATIGGIPCFYDLTCEFESAQNSNTLNVAYTPLAVTDVPTNAVQPNFSGETNFFSVYIGLPWGQDCIEDYVDELADLGVSHLTFVTDMDKVNIHYSNVFDWSGFERALDCASSNNMKAVCKIWNTEAGIPVSWADEDMLDQSGNPPRNRFTRTRGGHFPSLFSSCYRDSIKALINDGIHRFEENDTVSGWAFCLGDLEIFYPEYMYPSDDDRNLDNALGTVIYDYSETARQHFIAYLRDVRGFSLGQINSRWGCSYADWDAVGFPDYTGYNVLDPRLWWADFSDFRMYSILDLAEDIYGCIRDTGTGKDIYTYILEATPAMEALAKLSTNYNIKGLGSLTEPPYAPIFNSLLRHTGVEYHPEPAQTPPDPNLFFGGLYQLFTWGGNWGYSYVGFGRSRSTDEANYSYFEKMDDVMRQLLGSEPESDAPLALYSLYTQLHTTKSFIWSNVYHPLDFLRRMNREHLFFDFVSDMSSSELIDYSKHQVIFDLSSQILPESVLHSLSNVVVSGGTLVATSKSFRYCREHPDDDQLAWSFFGFDRSLVQQTFYPKTTVQLDGSVFDMSSLNQIASGAYVTNSAGLEVLGEYSGGEPAVVRWSFGQGKVILLLADVDYEKNPGFLSELYELAGGTRSVNCSNDVFRVSLKHNPDTDRFYILVQSWFGTEALTDAVTATLPSGNYSVTELFSGEETQISSAALSQTGLQVTLNPGYMKIYEFSPE